MNISQVDLSKVQSFLDSTEEFYHNTRNWAIAVRDAADLGALVNVMESNGSITNQAVLSSTREKFERAEKKVAQYEFKIADVIDNIAPFWKEIVD